MLKLILLCAVVVNLSLADEPKGAHTEDGLPLRSFFPLTREEQTGRPYSGSLSQPLIAGTEMYWGAKLTKWAWKCEASPSKWRAIRIAKGSTRLAAGLGGVAMMADNGVRAWVYFGLESDPTVSPLLTLTLGEDTGTFGGKDQKAIQALSAEEQDALIKEQLIATGVDVTGMASCKFLPDFLQKVTPQMIEQARAAVEKAAAEKLSTSQTLQATDTALAADKARFETLSKGPAALQELAAQHKTLTQQFEAAKAELETARKNVKVTGSKPVAQTLANEAVKAAEAKVTAARQVLATVTQQHRTLQTQIESALGKNNLASELKALEPRLKQLTETRAAQATAAESASVAHAAKMKDFLSKASPWARYGKEGFRKMWVGFKSVAGKAFVMDLEGRVYRWDSLGVDPSISPLVQWTLEDATAKPYQVVDKILKDSRQGWQSLEDTVDSATTRTKNRFSEILKKKD